MLTAEAIERVEQLTMKGNRVVDGVRAEPGDVYFKRNPDGTLERVVGERLRSLTAYSVAAFCETFAAHADEILNKGAVMNLYAGRGKVEAFLDEGRRESVTLRLPMADTFKQLGVLASKRQKMSQAEVIEFLRVDLAGCVSPEIVAAFRKLTFKKRSDGEHSLEHASKGVGLSITEDIVGGGGGIPETIKVTSRVYDDVDYEPDIDLYVSCLIDEGAFVLRPAPGALEEAVRDADAAVIEEIETITGACGGASVNVLHAGAES